MKTKSILLCLFLSLCVGFSQDADTKSAHPNFSGRWRMQKDQSDFGKFKMPDIVVRLIEQRGTTINVHTVQTVGQNTSTVDAVYTLDGSESKNVINGRDAVSRVFWDGKILVVHTDMRTAKNEEEQIEDRYELSEDGQMLTNTSHVVTDKGEAILRMVCSKEKVS